MAWTNSQKKTYAMACRAANISDENRRLILGHFDGRAFFDRNGKPCDEATSTSTKLTNADFESAMSTVEHVAGGQVLKYSRHYWQRKSYTGPTDRQRHKVHRIVETLTISYDEQGEVLLEPDGVGLSGWIRKSFGTDNLEDLDQRQLRNLIEALMAYGTRHGVIWNRDTSKEAV